MSPDEIGPAPLEWDEAANDYTALPMVPDGADRQGVFPAAEVCPGWPRVEALPIGTRGRDEYGAPCPCGRLHRHRGLGARRGVCGTRYLLVDPSTGTGERER